MAKFLDEDEQLILVGLSKKQLKNLPENIVGIERTENLNELVELYCFADVFVNPTYADTFPTTNLEALATGTPVITYNTGGSVEAVSESTGYVIEPGDIKGLLNAGRKIKLKGSKTYSPACRQRAVKNFDKFDRYEEYIHLYSSLMA